QRNEADGIGVAFERRLVYRWLPIDYLKIEEVFQRSPADGVLHAGDEVSKIGAEAVTGNLMDQALQLIKAAKPVVTLELKSGNEIVLKTSPYKWSPVMASRIQREDK